MKNKRNNNHRKLIFVWRSLFSLIILFGTYFLYLRYSSLSEPLPFSMSGTILQLSEEEILLEKQLEDPVSIQLSTDTHFERHYLNLEGELMEISKSSRGLLNLNEVVEVSGYLIDDQFHAQKIVSMEHEEEIKIKTDQLNSEFALLIDLERERTLLDINGDESMYPASMTKVMTAIVAIENLENLDDLIYISPNMFAELQIQNSSMAGFNPGSWVNALDVLYGIMLPSGGEATLAMAEHVGGTVEGFVEMMNQKAREIGMVATNFTNPIGLHGSNHYTTPKQIAVLVSYALQNEVFRQIFTADTYMLDSGAILTSTMFGLIPRTTVTNGQIIGGRTGFTLEAGRCLVSLAVIDGHEYLLVTGGAPNLPENQIKHLLDAIYIFDQI